MDKDDLILFNKNLESIIELYGKENKIGQHEHK